MIMPKSILNSTANVQFNVRKEKRKSKRETFPLANMSATKRVVGVPTVGANAKLAPNDGGQREDYSRGKRHNHLPRRPVFFARMRPKAKPPCFLALETMFQLIRCGLDYSLPFHKKLRCNLPISSATPLGVLKRERK